MSTRDLARHVVQAHGYEAMNTLENALDDILTRANACPAVELMVLASLFAQRLSPGGLSLDEGIDLLRAARAGFEMNHEQPNRPN